MPHTSRKTQKKQSSSNMTRVPSLYSVSGNLTQQRRNSNSKYKPDYENSPTEHIMMGPLDRWNSSVEIR